MNGRERLEAKPASRSKQTPPRAARMPGEALEAYEKRGQAVAKDYEKGTLDTSTTPVLSEFLGKEYVYGNPRPARKEDEAARLRREAEAKERRERRDRLWADLTDRVVPLLDAINWDLVLRKPQLTGAYRLPRPLGRARAPDKVMEFVAKQRGPDRMRIPEDLAHYPKQYFIWVHTAMHMANRPRELHAEETRKLRTKVAMLRAMAAEIVEEAEKRAEVGGEEAKSIMEDMRWLLGCMAENVKPMVYDIWEAGLLRDHKLWGGGGRRVRYVDGLPVNMAPCSAGILPISWKSRRHDLAKWSPCAQCEAAGVRECSSSRFLAADPRKRPCLRCRRLGVVCIRKHPKLGYYTDEQLARRGKTRWDTYEAADEKSLPVLEAQAVAKELLGTKRGKKLVNVCGIMVDVEDVKGFAPRNATLQQYLENRDKDKDKAHEEQEMLEGTVVSPSVAGQADRFAAEMSAFMTDEYWEQKAGRYGRGIEDWAGWTKRGGCHFRVRRPVPIPGWLLGM